MTRSGRRQPGGRTGGDLVVVTRYLLPWKADLAVSLLGSEGIEARLADEHFARNDPYHSAMAGGIRLMVRRSDEGRAREILEAADRGDMDLGERAGLHVQEPPSPGDVRRCPRCGSSHLKVQRGFKALLGPRVTCRVCGNTWRG